MIDRLYCHYDDNKDTDMHSKDCKLIRTKAEQLALPNICKYKIMPPRLLFSRGGLANYGYCYDV